MSDLTFAEYSEGKALLPIARKVDQVVQEGSELALLMPNARMCARCHYGPVELAAGSCNDLTMHHGRRSRAGTLDFFRFSGALFVSNSYTGSCCD